LCHHRGVSIPTPFTEFRRRIPSDFIDYNGHMNDAAYAQVLTEANELFLDRLGLSADYRDRTGCALYTVEMTIRFKREVSLDDELTAETLLASHDGKRVQLKTRLLAADGEPVATGETLYLHVDVEAGGVRSFPEDRAAALSEVQLAHDRSSPTR
jgi:acyl-CoA thioester hydrolase